MLHLNYSDIFDYRKIKGQRVQNTQMQLEIPLKQGRKKYSIGQGRESFVTSLNL